MGQITRLFIVDDHPVLRAGLRAVVAREASFEVVGEAGDAEAALGAIRASKPTVVVVDIELPGKDGLELARELGRLPEPPAVIVLTMFRQEAMVNAALDAGVQGYVLKDNAVVELIAAIRAVAGGEVYLSPAISGLLLKRRQRRQTLETEKPGLSLLTPTERRVLRLTADGRSCKEIAAEMSISHRTVETHRSNVARKLELRGDHRLLQFAIEHRSAL